MGGIGDFVSGAVDSVTGAVGGVIGGLTGGGKKQESTTQQFNYDPALTQGMLDINQQIADVSSEQWEMYQQVYQPYEQAMVEMNQSLLPHIRSVSSFTMQEQLRDLKENRPLKDKLRAFQAEGVDFQRRSLERGEEVERQFIDEATKPIDVEGRVQRARGLAQADVQQAFSQRQQEEEARLAQFGVDPTQGQSQAIQRRTSLAKAGALAGAMTQAEQQQRDTAENQRFARLSQAQQLQKGLGITGLAGVGSFQGSRTQQVGNFQLGNPANRALSGLASAQSGAASLANRQTGSTGTSVTPTASPLASILGTAGGKFLGAYAGGLGSKLV